MQEKRWEHFAHWTHSGPGRPFLATLTLAGEASRGTPLAHLYDTRRNESGPCVGTVRRGRYEGCEHGPDVDASNHAGLVRWAPAGCAIRATAVRMRTTTA